MHHPTSRLAFLVLGGCIVGSGAAPNRDSRISFELRLQLEQNGLDSGDGEVPVIIHGAIDRDDAARRGFPINTQVGDYATMMVPPSRLDELLLAFPDVTVDAAHAIELQSDASVSEIEAYRMWGYAAMPPTGTEPSYPGRSGRHVLVGIIDAGLDTWHPDLRRPCRAGETPSPSTGDCTRVVAMWNQTDITHTKPAGFSYGSEFSAASINNGTAVVNEKTNGLTFLFSPNDAAYGEYAPGHGTMVAGVAAGNGHGAARCTTSSPVVCDTQWKYFGVAPDADIALVMLGNLSDGSVVDGVNYLKGKAAALGEPLVVNLSLGANSGPHDGSSFMDDALARLSGPGVLVSAAAGNYGASRGHVRVSPATGETASIPFTTPPRGTGTENAYIAIEGWHDPSASFDLQLIAPSGAATSIVAPTGNSGTVDAPDGRLYLQNDLAADDTSKAKRAYIYLQSRAFGDNLPVAGTWTIKVTRRGGTAPLDFWLTTWKYPVDVTQPIKIPYFSGLGADATHTITSPGTADNVITTGAYTSQTRWTYYDGGTSLFSGNPVLQQIAPFSSIGPRRDGGQKPDLVAPGYGVFAPLAAEISPQTSPINKSVDGVHRFAFGTSIAAAHTTGALALLLEENPTLNPAEALDQLRGRARTDNFTGTSWSPTYGNGKLDLRALQPSTTTSVVETVIVGNLRDFGYRSQSADPVLAAPGFQVVVRTATGAPIAGMPVTLDFTGTPVKLGVTQAAGTAVSCTAHTLTATTNTDGVATFLPIIGGFVDTPSVRVSAAGVSLRSVPARSIDIDGSGTIALGDFALLSDALLDHPATPHTDFDLTGNTGLGDLAILQTELARPATKAIAFCP
jgi:hypothetical protein